MQLTVLGNHGPFAPAGGACSGYLLRVGGKHILLDCGNGVLSRLQAHIALEQIDAIVLSHLHSDHMSDMLILRYAWPLTRADKRIPVYLPPSPEADYALLAAQSCFETHVISDGLREEIAGATFYFMALSHPVMCFGMRVTAGRRTLAYTGDTRYTEALLPLTREADVLLCDSAFLEAERTEASPHMSAAQAARLKVRSGAQRLLLTHFCPLTDKEKIWQEAQRYDPEARMACEGEAIDI